MIEAAPLSKRDENEALFCWSDRRDVGGNTRGLFCEI